MHKSCYFVLALIIGSLRCRSKRITLSGEVANYVIGKNNIHMRIIEDITGVQVILDKYEKPTQDRVITLQ